MHIYIKTPTAAVDSLLQIVSLSIPRFSDSNFKIAPQIAGKVHSILETARFWQHVRHPLLCLAKLHLQWQAMVLEKMAEEWQSFTYNNKAKTYYLPLATGLETFFIFKISWIGL